MILPPPFCQQTRTRRLESTASTVYDLLVIGGGITGTGIARDAAMRGLRVALVEREDLATGTSSRSSKLVHGGLRYLENYEFGLVFESVSERALLRRLAPHLVKPMPFLFPGFKEDRVPLWMMGAGVSLYDLLSLGRAYRFHRKYGKQATTRLEPGLRSDGLKGSLLYYDCATDDARLTLATAMSAHDNGAHVFTRLQVDDLRTTRGKVEGVECTDLLTGEARTLHAHVVVCAVGPWTDTFLASTGRSRPPLLRTTKGVHMVVDRARLPVRHAVVMSGPGDHRILFAIPWGNRAYIGTTDTDFDGDLDSLHATTEDIDYLLGVLNRDFPGANIVPEDVLATWTGIRPLVADEGSASASAVSREHTIVAEESGLVIIAGGKLTTYRRMAAEVVEAARGHLRSRGVQLDRCRTHKHPLVGGGAVPPGSPDVTRALGREACDHLRERHGSDWDAVARLCASDPAYSERMVADQPILTGEVAHAISEEGALTIEDVLVRRTDLFFKAHDQGLECLEATADIAASLMGWDEARRTQEMEHYRDIVALSRRFRRTGRA